MYFLHFHFIFYMNSQTANSVDPDQNPLSAGSDLGLHCLPRSQNRDAWLIWG